MSSNITTDCTITHYFADHHTSIFWDELIDGREYSDDHITILDFNATTDKALKALHKSSVPLKDRLFGYTYTSRAGLSVIIAAVSSTMYDGLCRGYRIRNSDKSIVTHLTTYDTETIAAFNTAIERILSEMNISVIVSDEIVQAPPHLP